MREAHLKTCIAKEQELSFYCLGGGTLSIFAEEYSPIVSAVTEILSFRRTDRLRSTLYYILEEG